MLKDSTYHTVVSPYFDFCLYLSSLLPVGQIPYWRNSTHFPPNILISVLILKTLRSWVSYTARFQTVHT